jgi:hypothetical protein
MNKLPNNVLTFAGSGNTAPYEMFQDYFRHYRSAVSGAKNLTFRTHNDEGKIVTLDEKDTQMNILLKNEITRLSGISPEGLVFEQWCNHPTVKWATFAVVSAMIDAVLPETIIDSVGTYTDVRVGGWGDSFAFDIKPRDLFVVSKAGRARKQAEIQKSFNGQVTVSPEMRQITVGVSLFRVLAGKESLAEFVAKATRSLETQMTVDTYNAFATAMAALDNTANTGLRVAGYTQSNLVEYAQKVQSFNGGAKPVIMGTQLALQNILPANANYRYMLESDYVKIGYVPSAFGFDLMVVPQVAKWTTPFDMLIDDAKIWIVSPGVDKLVKLCLEGSVLSHVDDTFANANLAQNATMFKSYGVSVATSSVAATITLP